MNKKLLSVVTSIAAAGILSMNAFAAEDDSLQKVLDAGKLIVGTEGTYSPFTYHDEEGELVGYDVEVARAIGEKLGVEVQFEEAKWDSLLAGADAGRYDTVLNQVGVTEERKEKYDFSVPYTYSYGVLITTKDNEDIQNFDDLEGKKAAHTLTSNWAALSESYGAEIVGVDGFSQAVENVENGIADFTINDNIAFYDFVKQKSDANVEIRALTDEPNKMAVPLTKGRTTLLEAINDALTELAEDGTLTEISEKYFGSDVSAPVEE